MPQARQLVLFVLSEAYKPLSDIVCISYISSFFELGILSTVLIEENKKEKGKRPLNMVS